MHYRTNFSLVDRPAPWLLVLAGLLIVLPACSNEQASASPGAKGQSAPEIDNAVVVDTEAARSGPFEVTGHYAGEFVAEPRSELAAAVQGRLLTVAFDVGDAVDKGDVLATVDPRTYRQRVRELEAAVARARAEVEKTKVTHRNLKAELARTEPLLKRQIVSAREVDALRAEVDAAKETVSVAEASVTEARARLANAREDLRETKLTAPFAGRIAARHVDPGTQVGPGNPVYRLVGAERTFLRIDVPETDAARIRKGNAVTIRGASLGGRALEGAVERIAPSVDPTTRTLQVDVRVSDAPADSEETPNPDTPLLRPGMYARASVVLGQKDDAVTVPNQALQRDRDGAPFLWVVVDGKAQRREVTPGLEGGARTEITAGLEAGRPVIIRGHEKLEPDAPVRSIGE